MVVTSVTTMSRPPDVPHDSDTRALAAQRLGQRQTGAGVPQRVDAAPPSDAEQKPIHVRVL
jgi:hypothetical protein